MNTEKFIAWAIDNFGQNYGYSGETSTEEQITTEMIHEIYKGIYRKYAIKDKYIVSHHCQTCYENHPEKPYHLDSFTIFKSKVEEREEVDSVIKGIVPNPNAEVLREAYEFINLLERAALGLECAKTLLVKSSYLDTVKSLGEEKVNKKISNRKNNFKVVDELENNRNYLLDVENTK